MCPTPRGDSQQSCPVQGAGFLKPPTGPGEGLHEEALATCLSRPGPSAVSHRRQPWAEPASRSLTPSLPTPRLLLQAGYDPELRDGDGWTPLHAAAHWGVEDACRLLAEHGGGMDSLTHAVRAGLLAGRWG